VDLQHVPGYNVFFAHKGVPASELTASKKIMGGKKVARDYSESGSQKPAIIWLQPPKNPGISPRPRAQVKIK
jgi:hypothetical protein